MFSSLILIIVSSLDQCATHRAFADAKKLFFSWRQANIPSDIVLWGAGNLNMMSNWCAAFLCCQVQTKYLWIVQHFQEGRAVCIVTPGHTFTHTTRADQVIGNSSACSTILCWLQSWKKKCMSVSNSTRTPHKQLQKNVSTKNTIDPDYDYGDKDDIQSALLLHGPYEMW